jgi:hypothetical protein
MILKHKQTATNQKRKISKFEQNFYMISENLVTKLLKLLYYIKLI